jgi:insulysin
MKLLTKADMIEFFDTYMHPKSPTRAKLAIHLVAQAKSDVSTRQISELVKTLDLEDEAARQAATDLQARLTLAHHDVQQELDELRTYLLKDLLVAEAKIDAAVEAWKKLSKDHRNNGVANSPSEDEISNGTVPLPITDVRDFKCSLGVTGGPRPACDLSKYEDLDSKL